MKFKSILFSVFTIISLASFAADITPIPVEMTQSKGYFNLNGKHKIAIDAPTQDAQRLYDAIKNYIPKLQFSTKKANIILSIVSNIDGIKSPEGYALNITPKDINIKATSAAGLFYGLQSLIQMIEDSSDGRIEATSIIDEPRFEYRGMMLDISRHFRDKNFIIKQIDALAALKINRLHLHLTDGAGWRIEIKKYPRLTEYAAWRPQKIWEDWNSNGNKYSNIGDSCAFGGYLTQDEIREIVEYASDRYITVIPEIEMPSHSAEVMAAYPELSCTHEPFNVHDYCIGNEKTFEFIENVLTEVMDIFPSQYIHIGGDEASKQWWPNCELCKKRMEEENLNDVNELQSYLIHRVETFLNKNGRSLLGWDEIMEGGLAPNATVMSWRGTEGGIKAAQSGHNAIMTPGAYCYLDGYQDAPSTQPQAIGGYLPLNKVYSYNPIPDSLSTDIANHIIGVQGNLWCEYVPTDEHAEYMLYPRMVAIAEIGWSPQSHRNWDDFHRRALAVNDKMRAKGYHTFDLSNEVGNRPEALTPVEHLALGKKVTYNIPYWKNYPAHEETTLTDGMRGGWNYNDYLWQGFLYRDDERLDVTIDLEENQPIKYVGADFMQLCGPDVWMPQRVVISVSDNGADFTVLKEINHEQVKDNAVTFKTFDWKGSVSARYIRYQAYTDHGILFTDEIIVK